MSDTTISSTTESGDTILIIEDNPEILALNKAALTVRGYRVLDADTISRGRALFEQENPDLVMLDVQMPDGSGLCFCKELRSRTAIPILFLSGLCASRDIVAGLKAGGNDYVLKPYDLPVLMAKIEAQIRNHRLQRG